MDCGSGAMGAATLGLPAESVMRSVKVHHRSIDWYSHALSRRNTTETGSPSFDPLQFFQGSGCTVHFPYELKKRFTMELELPAIDIDGAHFAPINFCG